MRPTSPAPNDDGTTTACEWFDPNGLVAGAARLHDLRVPAATRAERHAAVGHALRPERDAPRGTYSDSDLAGGADDDVIFGQLGNDTIQGDGSVIDDLGRVTVTSRPATRSSTTRPSVEDYAGLGHRRRRLHRGQRRRRRDLRRPRPGRPHRRQLEPVQPARRRPAAGRQRHDLRRRRHRASASTTSGDLSATGHAHDADTILGDNGNIYRSSAPSASPSRRHGAASPPPRSSRSPTTTTPTSPSASSRAPGPLPRLHLRRVAAPTDTSARPTWSTARPATTSSTARSATTSSSATARTTRSSAAPATTGSTAAPATTASSATTAYFRTSRNGLAEPLWGVSRRPTRRRVALCDLCTVASLFPGALLPRGSALRLPAATDCRRRLRRHHLRRPRQRLDPRQRGRRRHLRRRGAAVLLLRHRRRTRSWRRWGVDPLDPLGYDAASRTFADFNADDPRSKVYDCTDGTKDVGIDGPAQWRSEGRLPAQLHAVRAERAGHPGPRRERSADQERRRL